MRRDDRLPRIRTPPRHRRVRLLAGCAATLRPAAARAPTPPASGLARPAPTAASPADRRTRAHPLDLVGSRRGTSRGTGLRRRTELTVTLSQEAIDAGLLPQVELISLSESGASGAGVEPRVRPDDRWRRHLPTRRLRVGNDELVGTAVDRGDPRDQRRDSRRREGVRRQSCCSATAASPTRTTGRGRSRPRCG